MIKFKVGDTLISPDLKIVIKVLEFYEGRNDWFGYTTIRNTREEDDTYRVFVLNEKKHNGWDYQKTITTTFIKCILDTDLGRALYD